MSPATGVRRKWSRERGEAKDLAVVEAVQHWEGGYRMAAAPLVRWCRRSVIVGGGPEQGEPFRVARWQEDWLRVALAPGIREAGLSVARKNGKSELIAALLLEYIAGPLNRTGWRGAVVSLNHRL